MRKQPDQRVEDGDIGITRLQGGDTLLVQLDGPDNQQGLFLTDYNAFRLFGLLSLFLDIKLPKNGGGKIQLGIGFKKLAAKLQAQGEKGKGSNEQKSPSTKKGSRSRRSKSKG